MKTVINILSISDVITNSSSEVFVMSERDAKYYDKLEDTCGCIDIYPIDWDFILNNREYEMVISLCNLDKSEILKFIECEKWYCHSEVYKGKKGYWKYPDIEDWKTFCEIHKDSIEELINKNLYFVDIEDHFANALEVTEDARDDSLWSDYRH